MQELFEAIEKKDFSRVRALINEGVNVNSTDPYGYSALHIASSKHLDDMAILLINSGIDVNLQDKNGQTVLHYVAEYNQLELAEAVLEKGGKLTIEDVHGNQPMWTAIFSDKGRNDRVEMIKLFLKNNADINHLNKAGKSPKDIVMIAGYNNLKPIIGITRISE